MARRSSTTWSTQPSEVLIDGQRLTAEGSTGTVGDIAWDLRWSPGRHLIDSRPALFGPLHPLDMEHTLLPEARFNGMVTVGDHRYEVEDVPGLVMHYWGRRLADRWCWISATEFPDDPQRRVEALIGRSSLWGTRRIQMTAAYVWSTDASGADFTLSPVNGLIRQRGQGDAVDLTSLRLDGKRHRITCRADPGSFNDLGEGIRQTLLADLTIDGHAAVPGTTGLEFRG